MIKLVGAVPSGICKAGVALISGAGLGKEGLAFGVGEGAGERALVGLFCTGEDLDQVTTSRRPFLEILASSVTNTPTAVIIARNATRPRVRLLSADLITIQSLKLSAASP